MPTTTDYEVDFYQWTQEQAALIRRGLFTQMDTENLAEEIESMGRSDKRSLGSYLEAVLLHLLKWQFQPEQRGNRWIESLCNGRNEIERLLEQSPSLVSQIPEMIINEYCRARRQATKETGLPLSTFPKQCPFSAEEIIADYWPD